MANELEKNVVRRRAKCRCEYCHAPEEITSYAFHIEHIHPRAEGGMDKIGNYALSCMPCNRAKWDQMTGEKQVYVRGKTPIGRATEKRLRMNQSRQIEARQFWRELELFP